MGRVRGRRETWRKGEEGKHMGRLDRRRRTGEGSLPTFWPNLHLSACSLGRSSGERSGRHSYWLRHWWGTQCLQERTTTNPQPKDLLHNVWGERYIKRGLQISLEESKSEPIYSEWAQFKAHSLSYEPQAFSHICISVSPFFMSFSLLKTFPVSAMMKASPFSQRLRTETPGLAASMTNLNDSKKRRTRPIFMTKKNYLLELGGIPVHTEYRCLFFLRYEFLKYRNTGVI